MSVITDGVEEARQHVLDNPEHAIGMTPFLLKQLAEGDIPKGLQAKIPEGYALVDVNDAYDKINDLADATKDQVSRGAMRFGFGGLIVGAALGGVGAYFITRRQLETKYNEIAEAEIAEMRQHYRDKTVALENLKEKPDLEKIVREQGYSPESPMAITPPTAIVEAAKDVEETPVKPKNSQEIIDNLKEKAAREHSSKEGSTIEQRARTRNVFTDKRESDDIWDYEKEKQRRSPVRPYVIHVDEKDDHDSYDVVTFTYYEEDDVLCNEADEVIGKDSRDALIGEVNLGKFGHGSGDPSIVYIRNDRLEMSMELVLSPNSYAEEVHGFQHSEPRQIRGRRRERRSPDDE